MLARCCLALMVLAALTAPLTLGASAQDYPSRPVKVIISITAGAGPDVITRIVGEHLGKRPTELERVVAAIRDGSIDRHRRA